MNAKKSGFTLIELSIVLVIIALVVSGIVVGKALISTAAVRATLSQLQEYRTAVNAFRGKYGGIPGDISDRIASQAGLATRPVYYYCGYGNSDGVIQSWGITWVTGCSPSSGFITAGEPNLFWRDLSEAKLIKENFTTATYSGLGPVSETSVPGFKDFYPQAKIRTGVYFFTFSFNGGPNYYGLGKLADMSGWISTTQDALTIGEAMEIDGKIDDGLPLSGRVLAKWLSPNSFNSHFGGCNNFGAAYQVTTYGEDSLSCSLFFQDIW